MGTSYKNHGGAFLSLNYFQVHLSFVFQTILLANLNVNADNCILLFLDQGNFEIWRVKISKHDSSDKRNLRDWHILFVFLLLLLLLFFFLLLSLLVGGEVCHQTLWPPFLLVVVGKINIWYTTPLCFYFTFWASYLYYI